jgi:hypothetical protein
MKYIYLIVITLIIGCASNQPNQEMTVFERTKCLKDKKLAEESGSGIIIECD